jgi:hypothetical protein
MLHPAVLARIELAIYVPEAAQILLGLPDERPDVATSAGVICPSLLIARSATHSVSFSSDSRTTAPGVTC